MGQVIDVDRARVNATRIEGNEPILLYVTIQTRKGVYPPHTCVILGLANSVWITLSHIVFFSQYRLD